MSETGFDYAAPLTPQEIAAGKHRRRVGGKWDRLGKLQLEFMKSHGLEPQHHLLDVGCGALRAGRRFIDYLEPAHYYGIDINQTLLDAGYDLELRDDQRVKLPRDNLRKVDRFECDFGVAFDYAMAQSVFTHTSLNHIRLALHQVAKVLKPGGVFFATFFEQSRETPLDFTLEKKQERPRRQESNPYWYYRSDMRWAASLGPWKFRYIGRWRHPVGQRMVAYTRTTD